MALRTARLKFACKGVEGAGDLGKPVATLAQARPAFFLPTHPPKKEVRRSFGEAVQAHRYGGFVTVLRVSTGPCPGGDGQPAGCPRDRTQLVPRQVLGAHLRR